MKDFCERSKLSSLPFLRVHSETIRLGLLQLAEAVGSDWQLKAQSCVANPQTATCPPEHMQGAAHISLPPIQPPFHMDLTYVEHFLT